MLSFTSSDGFHQRYDLIGLKKRGEAFIDRSIEYRGVVFLQEQADETKCVSVGLENKVGGNIRIFNKQDNIEQNVTLKDSNKRTLRLNGVSLVQTHVNNIKNLVCATNRGTVQVVQLHDLRAETQTIVAHYGECHLIQASVDGKYVFTAGVDGQVCTFKVSEYLPQMMGGRPSKQMSSEEADKSAGEYPRIEDFLAQIVLVNKGLMEEWRKSQEVLRLQMEEESNKVESSLRSEKYDFEKKIAKMEKQKTDELNELNRKYEQL